MFDLRLVVRAKRREVHIRKFAIILPAKLSHVPEILARLEVAEWDTRKR